MPPVQAHIQSSVTASPDAVVALVREGRVPEARAMLATLRDAPDALRLALALPVVRGAPPCGPVASIASVRVAVGAANANPGKWVAVRDEAVVAMDADGRIVVQQVEGTGAVVFRLPAHD
jgi:hypothetical protein